MTIDITEQHVQKGSGLTQQRLNLLIVGDVNGNARKAGDFALLSQAKSGS